MNDLMLKYETLSPELQKEVDDFLDFILFKYKGKKAFDISSWKTKIKSVSIWSEKDIEVFEESRQEFNQWKAEEW